MERNHRQSYQSMVRYQRHAWGQCTETCLNGGDSGQSATSSQLSSMYRTCDRFGKALNSVFDGNFASFFAFALSASSDEDSGDLANVKLVETLKGEIQTFHSRRLPAIISEYAAQTSELVHDSG